MILVIKLLHWLCSFILVTFLYFLWYLWPLWMVREALCLLKLLTKLKRLLWIQSLTCVVWQGIVLFCSHNAVQIFEIYCMLLKFERACCTNLWCRDFDQIKIILVLWLLSWDCFCTWWSTCGWFVCLARKIADFCRNRCWLGEVNLWWDIVEKQTDKSMMLSSFLGVNCGGFQGVLYCVILETLLALNEYILLHLYMVIFIAGIHHDDGV